MSPNLFLATQTLFSPHKWFKAPKSERPARRVEHWDSPVAGLYEYIPGRGWYLVATDKAEPTKTNPDKAPKDDATPSSTTKESSTVSERETIRMAQPVQVKYSKVLKRYLLGPDYEMRRKHGNVQDARGKSHTAGFFRLDDGIAWVECFDEEGEFIPGPYILWCIDERTGAFRHMLKGDDPAYIPSRQNSFEGEPGRRRSQESMSTRYRSGPSSVRDGPSVPGTRTGSIKAATPLVMPSQPVSQNGSRRNSLNKSYVVPLEEAKERLRKLAEEDAYRSRANSWEDGRGRPFTRT